MHIKYELTRARVDHFLTLKVLLWSTLVLTGSYLSKCSLNMWTKTVTLYIQTETSAKFSLPEFSKACSKSSDIAVETLFTESSFFEVDTFLPELLYVIRRMPSSAARQCPN